MLDKTNLIQLVFSNPARAKGEPFTTSDLIAQGAGVQHKAVQQLILRYDKDLQSFGKVTFKIRPLTTSKTGQSEKIYELNEQQATLLITYLKNTETVRTFKKELVRQFYNMRDELIRRNIAWEDKKPTRKSLTNALRDSGEDERMHGKSWGTYTNMIYTAAIGRSVKQLQQERANGQKVKAIALMTAEEIKKVEVYENRVIVLLDMGLQYAEIKKLLQESACQKTTAKAG